MSSLNVVEWMATADGFTAMLAGLVFVVWCLTAVLTWVQEEKARARPRGSLERPMDREDSPRWMFRTGTPALPSRA